MNESQIIKIIQDKSQKRKDIGHAYFMLMLDTRMDGFDSIWSRVNKEILKRYSNSGLIFIKDFAWKKFNKYKNRYRQFVTGRLSCPAGERSKS